MKAIAVRFRRRRMPPARTDRMTTNGERSKASDPLILCWDIYALPD